MFVPVNHQMILCWKTLSGKQRKKGGGKKKKRIKFSNKVLALDRISKMRERNVSS